VLTRNHRQEALTRAYVQAVAARCGLGVGLRDFDYGIDLTLHHVERRGNRYLESGFRLDVQAKSTTGVAGDGPIPFDLDVRAYDNLRNPGVGCPRILVLLVLPSDEARWTDQTEDHLLIRHCCYWCSLYGRGPTTNRKSVRVEIPRSQMFSVDALRGLIERVRQGAVL
jgi:hypothetical protein